MTYGRARLWLGVTGVGSLVMITTTALILGLPSLWFEQKQVFGAPELIQLMAVIGCFMLWLTPLDFLGGYYLPQRFHKSDLSIGDWLRNYIPATLMQSILFVFFGSMIVLLSQILGTSAGVIAVGLFMLACFLIQNRLILARQVKSETTAEKLENAIAMIQAWRICTPRIVVVEHSDQGFTGGLIGLGKGSKIVIPQGWLAFDTEQLATVIARRAWAINSGSYTRGLIVAICWNLAGFLICLFLPEAGLTSVAGLVTTLCGFTLWSFAGLLVLPTVSRNASLKIDEELIGRGLPFDLISNTASSMDQRQDNEPERPQLIELIFHPVPSVKGRIRSRPVRGFAAWNVARTALFLSWGCLGFLSRSVHCNVGRPDLWMMLPTD